MGKSSKINTRKLESKVLKRVKNFLPQMAEAQSDLMKEVKQANKSVNIEDIEDGAPHIAMDLALVENSSSSCDSDSDCEEIHEVKKLNKSCDCIKNLDDDEEDDDADDALVIGPVTEKTLKLPSDNAYKCTKCRAGIEILDESDNDTSSVEEIVINPPPLINLVDSE